MSTVIEIGVALLGLGGVLGAVLYCWSRAVANRAALVEGNAALQVEQQRVAQQEAAAEAERAQRREAFNAQAAAVTDVAGADQLLRDATAGGPKAG